MMLFLLQKHWCHSFYHSAAEFDVSEIEKLFSNQVAKPAGAAGKANEKKKAAGSKPEVVHVVI